MTEDITSLQIKILYDSVEKAEARLKKLETTGTKTKKTVEGFGSKIGSSLKGLYAFAAGATVVTGAIAAMKAIIDKTAEFQKLKAGLITATGSVEKAGIAFQALQDYAQNTPSSLVEVTEAFTKLVNYGLTPSERALTAYGNTASAMGKSLNQMVEAVADATTGEFERLKEFGIKAKTEGDQITFRFRGVSTTVKNSAAEIESYLIGLSEKNFGGAMAEQMQTLNGKFSALGDEWDKLLAGIGENGLGDAVGGGIQNVIDLLSELNAMIASGQLQAGLDGWGIAFSGYVDDVSSGLSYLNELFVDHSEQGKETGMTLAEGLVGGMKAVVSGYRAYVKTAATILWGLVDSAVAVGKAIYQTIAASFNALIGASLKAGTAIGNALWAAVSGGDAKAALIDGFDGIAEEITGAADTTRKAWDQSIAKVGINADTVAYNVADAWKDAGSEIDAAAMKEAEANDKRAKYDADRAKRLKEGKDRLAGMGVGVDTQGSGKPKKSGGGGGGRSEFETLEDSLRNEENLIAESYQRRFDLIEQNTREGSAYQAELEISLTEKFQEEQMKRVDAMKEMPEKMFEAYALEESIIEESYARRKEIILNATELTEAEKMKMLEEAELQYTDSIRKHQIERNKVQLGIMGDFFGNISAIAGAFGKKGAKIAKAAAIAETTVKTYQSATAAYASLAGIPYVGPALGAAAAGAAIAAGLANIQKIKSTDDSGGYSGAYAIGGAIPAGKFGLVGEAGPELVKGPAMVTSAQATWDRRGGAQASGGENNVEVKIINMTGEKVTKRESQEGDKKLIEFIIGQASDRVAGDIKKGGTGVAKAIEGTYNLGRGKRA